MQADEAAQLRSRYEHRLPLLEAQCEELHRLSKLAAEDFVHPGHIDRITFRVKDPDSFVKKVADRREKPDYDDPLIDVEDQLGGRVIVLFPHDVDLMVDRLLAAFNPFENKHHAPEWDEAFGYESTHLVCRIPPQRRPVGWDSEASMPEAFELQVRTIFMHAYAQPNHDLGYKAKAEITRRERRRLAWIAASAWGADEALETARKEADNSQAAREGGVGNDDKGRGTTRSPREGSR